MAWPKGVPRSQKFRTKEPVEPVEPEVSALPEPPDVSAFTDETERDVAQGQQAQRLMDDPGFKLAVSRVEALYLNEARTGKTVEDRETAWARLRGLDDVCTQLKAVYGNGLVAQRKIARSGLVAS